MKYAFLFFLFLFVLNVDYAGANNNGCVEWCNKQYASPKNNGSVSQNRLLAQKRYECIEQTKKEGRCGETAATNSGKKKDKSQLSSSNCDSGLTGANGCSKVINGKCNYSFNNCRDDVSCDANGGIFKGNKCLDRSKDGFDLSESASQRKTDDVLCKEKNGTPDKEGGCICKTDPEKGSIDPSNPAVKCNEEAASVVHSDKAIKLCQDRQGKYISEDQKCECDDGRSTYAIDLIGNSFTCVTENVQKSAENVASCLQAFKTAAKACKDNGSEAIEKCNKDNTKENEQWSAAQSVITPMAQIMQMRGQQQGSAETCFQAGALATTTYGAMDLLKKDCNDKIETCNTKCKEAEDAYRSIQEDCKIEAQGKPPGYMAKLQQDAEKINSDFEVGVESCNSKAKTNQARIIEMMNGMNRSAQQAAKCQCQLTAGQTNCDQILGPADCQLTPKDPRCPQAVTVKCAGTDYNSKECICLRDPKAVSCIGTTGSGVSQVAGFNPVGAGSTSFKAGGAGGGGIGIGDFPSDAAAAVSSDKTQGGVDSPFGVAGGGGGGGSGGGGGGSEGGDGEGGMAEPEAKSGIAGLFNNLKTGVAGLFGGGSGKKGSADGKNFSGKTGTSRDVDPNKWRPLGLRGIAGGNGIGGKNSDIFKMVNNQYNNQYHTLMTLPAEKPK